MPYYPNCITFRVFTLVVRFSWYDQKENYTFGPGPLSVHTGTPNILYKILRYNRCKATSQEIYFLN